MGEEQNGYHNDIAQYEEDRYEQEAISSAQRVRRALFPDIYDSYPASSSPSFLDQLAGPSLDLQNAIIDLLNVEDEMQTFSKTMAGLVSLLVSSDPAKIHQAVTYLGDLSKGRGFSDQVANDPEIMDSLITGLISALGIDNPAIQQEAARILANLSSHKAAQLCIFRSGGIAELIRMLSSRDTYVRRYAVTTLHNLLIFLETAKDDIISYKGLEAFIPLLRENNEKMQAAVADCIFLIMNDRPNCKEVFLKHNGNQYLVSILSTNTQYIKLIYAVIRCLQLLSTEEQNKEILVQLGCLELLHEYLDRIEEPKKKLNLLNIIRNMSHTAAQLDTLAPLIQTIVELLNHSNDDLIVSCICGILSNLTCNNVTNKQTVTKCGGITILLKVAGHFAAFEDVTEPALCTIRHCTIRHEYAIKAREELMRINKGLHIIVCLLSKRNPPIVKAALGVLRNCAIQDSNLEAILSEETPSKENVITIAIEVLESSGDQLRVDFNALTEGVSLIELVEVAISLFHQLARDFRVAKIIYSNHRIMNILVYLLGVPEINNPEDYSALREDIGLLYQLSGYPEGQTAIVNYGAVPYITNALNIRQDRAIEHCASGILKNLNIESSHPSQKYRAYTDTLGSNGRIVQQEYRGSYGWVNEGLEPEQYSEYTSEMQYGHIDGHHENKSSWFDTDL